jgi:hypothetical protein
MKGNPFNGLRKVYEALSQHPYPDTQKRPSTYCSPGFNNIYTGYKAPGGFARS